MCHLGYAVYFYLVKIQKHILKKTGCCKKWRCSSRNADENAGTTEPSPHISPLTPGPGQLQLASIHTF